MAAQVFAAQVVQLDVTGRGFERMTQFRRSLMHVEYKECRADRPSKSGTSSGRRRRVKKRRNTIACDDRRDIEQVISPQGSPLTR